MPSSLPRSPWIYTTPVIVILISHYVVDTYSSAIPPLIGVVEQEYQMQPQWLAVLLGVGSICSGLAQPLFAWISDRTQTRRYGPIGILLAALGIGFIGYAPNTVSVFLIYAIAMIGIGMFHPIATARIGAIAGEQRSFALSLFFVFGMGGFFTGSLLAPYLTTGAGTLKSLSYLIVPGIIMTIALQRNINQPLNGLTAKSTLEPPPRLRGYDWWSVLLLYVSAVFRFFVNMAIIYLLVRWVEQYVADLNPTWTAKQVADTAAPIAGRANAAMFLGQGLGGLAAGAWIPTGREKLPLILTPIVFAPFMVALAFLQPNAVGYIACFFAGIGFAAMTPITISVGQRLMPHHTRLASGLMLGGAWAIAATGPRAAELLNQLFGLKTAIIVIGLTLTLAGIAAIGVRIPSRRTTP